MMAVRCIGKGCKNCPELDIETISFDYSNLEERERYEVDLKCRHVSRCERIREMMEKEGEKG